ncbi:TPA: TetR/AcrR family transcriptional regulator [Serratia marcescens]|nr:TetR/AcrR family transcriptional regulator [Serratia marcescens]
MKTNIGRPQSIDRDYVMDIAERIIIEEGISALTIGYLAKRSGISKGGAQYIFENKANLVSEIFKRLTSRYEESISKVTDGALTASDKIKANIALTFQDSTENSARVAALTSAILRDPVYMSLYKEWYASMYSELDTSNHEGRLLRLKLLATEGAYMLRYFGFMNIDENIWMDIFNDIENWS